MAGEKEDGVKELAVSASVLNSIKQLTGPERAAALLLALGDQYGAPIWRELDDNEIASISIAMSNLGTMTAEVLETLLGEFVSQMSLAGAVMGNFESTERLLMQFLTHDRVNHIMEEIRGPAGRNMWEKLSNVQANVLANYLKNEYPQTVAVILSKIASDHAAKVLTILPDDFSLEVVQRMLGMDSVQKEILEKIEQTLRTEFISNLASTRRRDSHELMAEIFNNFDRQSETKFLTALDEVDRDATDKIKSLMFTFEDLTRLDDTSCQTLLSFVEKEVLQLAMKGATDTVRQYFFKNMSERAANMMLDDIEAMGPVRLSEVDEAQNSMIGTAKDLAQKGDIIIIKKGSESKEQIVY
ncbi:MAG: flagellar motor switch protein FliG [Methyloligellaceae bacterium]